MQDLPPCKNAEEICIRLAVIETLISTFDGWENPPIALIGKLRQEREELELQLSLEEAYEAANV